VLEKNKRGKSLLLPLTGAPFQVPANVYLIGTMNTADRSIALLDTALRRRFGFIELMPDSSVLGDAVVGGIPLGPWLEALNRRLCDHIGRDARNLQIGHAYLLEGDRPLTDFPKLSKVIQEEIIPLLEEYCYEDYATLEKILGPGLVDIHAQHMRYELFEDSRQDELVQALLLTVRSFFSTVFSIWQVCEITEFLKVDGPSALCLFGALDSSVCCGVAVRLYEGSQKSMS
jgi:5-methylcytosine-specific restriction protein B